VFSLAGKKALVVGIANEESIAFGCAKAFRAQGADLAITFQGTKAEPFVRPIAEKLGTDIVLPLDVRENGQFGQLFDSIRQIWGQVDICLHSIAFCPKDDLHSRVVDCSRDGFITAMDISVYSFIRMVRRDEPLMRDGGTCMTVSFFGSEKVVEHYNIMGPVKAALEAATRYMAAELGPKGIRVHAISIAAPPKADAPMTHRSTSEVTEYLAMASD
jgi:enoyl-[acyl-carrier protein] reductase I